MTSAVWLLAIAMASAGCTAASGSNKGEDDDDTGADSDTDTDVDTDTDSDTDADSDTDTDTDTLPEIELSYIWVTNHIEGTVSKIDTQTEVEVGRYRTCPYDSCGPSRTSVNLHGDVVVTNQWSFSGNPSGAVKFAANVETDCVDQNDNDEIETSSGSTNVLPWDEEECRLWYTELTEAPSSAEQAYPGARATAWDGQEDMYTGEGGHVYIGMCTDEEAAIVYMLDGDDGEVLDQASDDMLICASGGAMAGTGTLWITDFLLGQTDLIGLDVGSYEFELIDVPHSSGITIDGDGRVWTVGGSYIARYDPATLDLITATIPATVNFLHCIAAGVEASDGYVWVTDGPPGGVLHKIDEETLLVEASYTLTDAMTLLYGVSIDFEGNVWATSRAEDVVYKLDPVAETFVSVPVGNGPEPYSDMTGVQYREAVIIE